MRWRVALVVGLVISSGLLLHRVQTKTISDPLSGFWSGDWGPTPTHRNYLTVDLRWNGTKVTGAINPGPHAIRFTKTSFDVQTGALHLELDVPSTDHQIHYLIDGQIDEGALIGTWKNETSRGNFRLIKK